MAHDIQWEDAPPTARRPGTRRGGKYGEFARRLRENPGKGAKLEGFPSPDAARAFANSVERGRKAGFKEGVWEAAVEDTTVWVKFVRDADPAEAAAQAAADDGSIDDDGPEPTVG